MKEPGAPNGARQSLHRGREGMKRSRLPRARYGCVPLRKSCHSSWGDAYGCGIVRADRPGVALRQTGVRWARWRLR
jgi:hypothetical protein